jgi:hypothetical protein
VAFEVSTVVLLKIQAFWDMTTFLWVDYCRHLKDHDVFIYLCLEMQVTLHDPSEDLEPFTQWIPAELNPWVIIVASHIAWLYWTGLLWRIATWITGFIIKGLHRIIAIARHVSPQLGVLCDKLYQTVSSHALLFPTFSFSQNIIYPSFFFFF